MLKHFTEENLRRHKLLTVVVFLVVIVGAFFACNHWNRRSEAEAEAFCESLISQVEEIKRTTGKFPEQLDPSWIQDKTVPRLIHPQEFYAGHEDYYEFHFRNPGRLNDLFVFNSEIKVWLNGD